jgi:hypothetical protein
MSQRTYRVCEPTCQSALARPNVVIVDNVQSRSNWIGRPSFLPFLETMTTESDDYRDTKGPKEVPEWRRVARGLDFEKEGSRVQNTRWRTGAGGGCGLLRKKPWGGS